jgi:hypothetical protein
MRPKLRRTTPRIPITVPIDRAKCNALDATKSVKKRSTTESVDALKINWLSAII